MFWSIEGGLINDVDAGSRSDKDSPGRDRYRPWGKVILNVSYFPQSLYACSGLS